MLQKIFDKVKPRLHNILFISALLILIGSSIYTELNNIDTKNTIEAMIIIVIFYSLISTGLWIYSNKIKEGKKKLSIGIKILVCWISITIFIIFNIAIFKEIKNSCECIWLPIIILILFLSIAISLVTLFIVKKIKEKNRSNDENQEERIWLKEYFKTMNNKLLRFTMLLLGFVLAIAGFISTVNSIKNGFIKNIYFGSVIYCVGFLLLGGFTLMLSKDLNEKKKTLSKVLKILSLYWIIFSSVILVLSLVQILLV